MYLPLFNNLVYRLWLGCRCKIKIDSGVVFDLCIGGLGSKVTPLLLLISLHK